MAKRTETIKEFRGMADDQLNERLGNLRVELFKLREKNASEKVKDVSQFNKLRKDIARIETLKSQRAKAAAK